MSLCDRHEVMSQMKLHSHIRWGPVVHKRKKMIRTKSEADVRRIEKRLTHWRTRYGYVSNWAKKTAETNELTLSCERNFAAKKKKREWRLSEREKQAPQEQKKTLTYSPLDK